MKRILGFKLCAIHDVLRLSSPMQEFLETNRLATEISRTFASDHFMESIQPVLDSIAAHRKLDNVLGLSKGLAVDRVATSLLL